MKAKFNQVSKFRGRPLCNLNPNAVYKVQVFSLDMRALDGHVLDHSSQFFPIVNRSFNAKSLVLDCVVP